MLTAALNQGLPSPIDIQVEGSKLEILNEIATTLAREFERVPGAVDVRVAQRIDFPAIRIEVDRTKAALLGLTQRDLVENVVTATNSSISFAKSFWIDERNGNHYCIGAQYPEEDIADSRMRLLAARQTDLATERATVAASRIAILEAAEIFDELVRTQNEIAIAGELLAGSRAIADLERAREAQGTRLSPWIPSIFAGASVAGFGQNFTNLDDREEYRVGLAWDLSLENFGRSDVPQVRLAQEQLNLTPRAPPSRAPVDRWRPPAKPC